MGSKSIFHLHATNVILRFRRIIHLGIHRRWPCEKLAPELFMYLGGTVLLLFRVRKQQVMLACKVDR
jgi:hypothetical protein